MGRLSAAEFEARYREDPDPWGYTYRCYEQEKYGATLDACGPGPFRSALELGSSIGVLSALLAPRCHRLVTIDAAPTAVAAARTRLVGHPQVQPILGAIPADVPERRFDLVLASEILYYLSGGELEGTLATLREQMFEGARLVAVHWRPAGPERPFDAGQVHGILREQPWLSPVRSGGTEDYLLDVVERR